MHNICNDIFFYIRKTKLGKIYNVILLADFYFTEWNLEKKKKIITKTTGGKFILQIKLQNKNRGIIFKNLIEIFFIVQIINKIKLIEIILRDCNPTQNIAIRMKNFTIINL